LPCTNRAHSTERQDKQSKASKQAKKIPTHAAQPELYSFLEPKKKELVLDL
jgi:hypothetical protein